MVESCGLDGGYPFDYCVSPSPNDWIFGFLDLV